MRQRPFRMALDLSCTWVSGTWLTQLRHYGNFQICVNTMPRITRNHSLQPQTHVDLALPLPHADAAVQTLPCHHSTGNE